MSYINNISRGRDALCTSPKGLNRLDYSLMNSFGYAMHELFDHSDITQKTTKKSKKSYKIPADQNVNARRPLRGRGPDRRGCPRRRSQTGDQCKTPKYPTTYSNPTPEYSEYITIDEWTASNDELRATSISRDMVSATKGRQSRTPNK